MQVPSFVSILQRVMEYPCPRGCGRTFPSPAGARAWHKWGAKKSVAWCCSQEDWKKFEGADKKFEGDNQEMKGDNMFRCPRGCGRLFTSSQGADADHNLGRRSNKERCVWYFLMLHYFSRLCVPLIIKALLDHGPHQIHGGGRSVGHSIVWLQLTFCCISVIP